MSCSTKKNTFVSRNYHNLTSYYNVYWNGQESYKTGLEKLKNAGLENYNQVLPVFEYGTPKDSSLTSSQMKKAIEKGAKCIKKHSILIKGIEHVKYIDDAYLLMGKSYVYTYDHSAARSIFNFVESQFAKEPSKYEALLWSARTYILDEEYDVALSNILQVKEHASKLSKQTAAELPLVEADYYIAREEYAKAIQPLKKGLELNKDHDLKNRINFILAQIYQNQNRLNDAYQLYRTVTKSRALLSLDFNARLNMALCYSNQYGNSKEIVKDLEKLLKDEKNKRSFGRIYYVLAEVAMKDRKQALAIEYLEKSVEASAEDPDQLIKSAIKLGDYYYDKPDYVLAQQYYSVANDHIDMFHPDYDRVSTRAANLQQLVDYLAVADHEKTRLSLMNMSEKERDAYAEKEVKKYQEKVKKEKALEEAKAKNNTTATPAQSGSWYFYNNQTKVFGYNEFIRKWGRRNLEDFWFLIDKPQYSEDLSKGETEQAGEGNKAQETALMPDDKAYYLKDIPKTNDEIKEAEISLEEAMLGAGKIYAQSLNEPALAIQMYEELLKQLPDAQNKVEIYYQLYYIYFTKKDEVNKKKYADLILSQYPKSEQAARINDPNFLKNQQASSLKAGELYEYTFIAYTDGAYDAVLRNVKEAETKYPNNVYTPQFKFLEAASLGALQGANVLITQMDAFIKDHPSEKTLVELGNKMIEFAKQNQQMIMDAAKKSEKQDKPFQPDTVVKEQKNSYEFSEDKNTVHYVVIGYDPGKIQENILKTRLSDFNRRSFPEKKLSIANCYTGSELPCLCIAPFDNAGLAMQFYQAAINSAYLFAGEDEKDRLAFVISEENLRKLQNQTVLKDYLIFFEQTYVQKNK